MKNARFYLPLLAASFVIASLPACSDEEVRPVDTAPQPPKDKHDPESPCPPAPNVCN